MSNLSSWIGNAPSLIHNSLVAGGAADAAAHLATGVSAGAGLGFASSLYNGTGTPVGDTVNGALQGAALGAVSRYASSRYTQGAFSAINHNAMNPAAREVMMTSAQSTSLANRNTRLQNSTSNLSFANFTMPVNKTPFWNVDNRAVSAMSSPTDMRHYKTMIGGT